MKKELSTSIPTFAGICGASPALATSSIPLDNSERVRLGLAPLPEAEKYGAAQPIAPDEEQGAPAMDAVTAGMLVASRSTQIEVPAHFVAKVYAHHPTHPQVKICSVNKAFGRTSTAVTYLRARLTLTDAQLVDLKASREVTLNDGTFAQIAKCSCNHQIHQRS